MYYRGNPSLIVINEPDAICKGRPQKYIDHEDAEVQRTAAEKAKIGGDRISAEHLEWTGEK